MFKRSWYQKLAMHYREDTGERWRSGIFVRTDKPDGDPLPDCIGLKADYENSFVGGYALDMEFKANAIGQILVDVRAHSRKVGADKWHRKWVQVMA